MKKQLFLFAVASASLLACGDNLKAPVDSHPGGTDTGSGSNGPPAPPALGAQIDRMGRPVINTALNHGFDGSAGVPSSAALASKDAYNHDEAVGMWPTTWAPTLAHDLAILDALDTGVCGNGICETNGLAIETTATCMKDCPVTNAITGSDGCGNQAFYNPANGAAAYGALATVLADDELYLDTSKGACTNYLAVEFYIDVLGTSPASCGGRAPTYDVIDTVYTLASIGVGGFNPANFMPAFGDTVDAHTDVSDTTFPFLGAPH